MLAMGIIGGVIGLIACYLAIVIIAFASVFGSSIYIQSWMVFVAVLLSILGIIAGVIAKRNRKQASVLFLISGIVGFVCIYFLWSITGILFIIAGLIGIYSKPIDSRTGKP
jgi:hypothetical protein